jgi:hypothetical protein
MPFFQGGGGFRPAPLAGRPESGAAGGGRARQCWALPFVATAFSALPFPNSVERDNAYAIALPTFDLSTSHH